MPACHYSLTTAHGDVDGREGFIALDVDGTVLGRVRTQRQLSQLEDNHGSIILLKVGDERYPDVAALLANPETFVTTSKQGNQTTIISAAYEAAIRASDQMEAEMARRSQQAMEAISQGKPVPAGLLENVKLSPEGKGIQLVDRLDNAAVMPSFAPPLVEAAVGSMAEAVAVPDPARVSLAGVPRDPGPKWREHWARHAERAASAQTPEAWAAAGEMIHARAYALALDESRARLGMYPHESPAQAFMRLNGEIAVSRVRAGALKYMNKPADAYFVEAELQEKLQLRGEIMLEYTRAARSLIMETRPFGSDRVKKGLFVDHPRFSRSSDAKNDREARDLARRAVDLFPSAWLEAVPELRIEDARTLPGMGQEQNVGGFYVPPNPYSCPVRQAEGGESADGRLGELVALVKDDRDRALSTAVHEMTHVVQFYSPAVRALEDAFLRSAAPLAVELVDVAPEVSPVPVPRGMWEVRNIVPGDPYANVRQNPLRVVDALISTPIPTGPSEAAIALSGAAMLAEFLPQAMGWLAYEPQPGLSIESKKSTFKEWSSRMWLANPYAVNFVLGALSGA